MKVKVIGKGQGKTVRSTQVSTAASYKYCLSAVTVGFLLSCIQLSASASEASRAAWKVGNFKFLTVQTLNRFELRPRAKFCRNRSKCG